MKKSIVAGVVVALSAMTAVCRAQDAPELPQPAKEHQWLQQLVGEWEAECKMFARPGQPPVESKGTEHIRRIGGFWIVAENKSSVMGQQFTGLLTLGYNSQKQQYVGTWTDSMTDYLWVYQGAVDKTGKVLTLATEGPCPMRPGETSQFKEVIEIKNKDHKVFTSSMQGEDGKWTTVMQIDYRRKK